MTPIDQSQFRSKVESLQSLPTLPGVVAKLSAMVDSSTTSTAQVGEMIQADQVLSAKVLRLTNSAFFGFPGKIGTVTHALVLLGFNAVKGLVLTASVFDVMAGEMLALWMHSLGVSMTAGIIARRIGLKDPEEVQVAGLIHDIGKVVLKVEEPDYFDEVSKKVKESGMLFIDAEKEVLGLDHTRVADWLSDKWNLPASIREPITLHHTPLRADSPAGPTGVIHLADVLVRSVGFGSGGDNRMPVLEREVVKALNLSLSEIEEILQAMDEEFVKAEDLIPVD
ncbi:MAG: HDOD domain-containing protein [bacterium]